MSAYLTRFSIPSFTPTEKKKTPQECTMALCRLSAFPSEHELERARLGIQQGERATILSGEAQTADAE